MDWQKVIALTVVAATAGIFAWQKLRRRKKTMFGPDGHCGCGSQGGPAEKSSIVFHARKGERPEIIVKPK